jgi:CxxC-x17-CxxC domain-containing protein
MIATALPPTSTGTRTEITCTKCGKAASVPFVPTPGRPVFCRDCFVRPTMSSGPGRSFDARTPGTERPARAPVPGARKRMLAQGRKGHFMYDAKEVLAMNEGGMDDKDARAFLEGLFARGARISTEDAQVFLDEKLAEAKIVTLEQRNGLGRLLERYSFWR